MWCISHFTCWHMIISFLNKNVSVLSFVVSHHVFLSWDSIAWSQHSKITYHNFDYKTDFDNKSHCTATSAHEVSIIFTINQAIFCINQKHMQCSINAIFHNMIQWKVTIDRNIIQNHCHIIYFMILFTCWHQYQHCQEYFRHERIIMIKNKLQNYFKLFQNL